MSKGNFEYNYPRVIKYLQDNDIEYIEYANGQHLRILGAVSLVDLWPSRMTYHIVESEEAHDIKYHKLDINFDKEQLEKLLS
jgi:hypothetical protein